VLGAPLGAGLEHLEDRLGTVGIVVGALSDSVSHLHSSLQHFANGEFADGLSDLVQSPVDLVEGAWDAGVDVVEDTVDSLEDLGTAVADAASDVAEGVGNAVESTVDSIGASTGWW
jgi:phage-related protein